MNRSEARRKLNFEIIRRNLVRQYEDDDRDEMRASHMPDPKKPVRREADSTDQKRISDYINRVRAIFRAPIPPSPTTIEIKPRPISVGTQTWPTTTFRPLMSLASTPKKTDMPAKVTAYSMIIQPTSNNTTNPTQPKAGAKKIALHVRKSAKVNKYKSKCANKIVRLNNVSKRGRYDLATTKRSVSPVFSAQPSVPFQ